MDREKGLLKHASIRWSLTWLSEQIPLRSSLLGTPSCSPHQTIAVWLANVGRGRDILKSMKCGHGAPGPVLSERLPSEFEVLSTSPLTFPHATFIHRPGLSWKRGPGALARFDVGSAQDVVGTPSDLVSYCGRL
jgi:hypothetical protein